MAVATTCMCWTVLCVDYLHCILLCCGPFLTPGLFCVQMRLSNRILNDVRCRKCAMNESLIECIG